MEKSIWESFLGKEKASAFHANNKKIAKKAAAALANAPSKGYRGSSSLVAAVLLHY